MPRPAPDRGDIIWLDFDRRWTRAGRPPPGVVLSHRAYNAKTGLAIVCP